RAHTDWKGQNIVHKTGEIGRRRQTNRKQVVQPVLENLWPGSGAFQEGHVVLPSNLGPGDGLGIIERPYDKVDLVDRNQLFVVSASLSLLRPVVIVEHLNLVTEQPPVAVDVGLP